MEDIILLAILIALVIFYLLMSRTVTIDLSGGEKVKISGWFDNKYKAAICMKKIKDFLLKVGRTLKLNQSTYDFGDKEIFVDNILKKYNPDVLTENPPLNSDSSYVINKGEVFDVCLRNKFNYDLHDDSLLYFVVLHEISHIGSPVVQSDEDSHNKEFWDNFAWLLKFVRDAGLYEPIDYSKYPTVYCGKKVAFSPYYDRYPEHAALTKEQVAIQSQVKVPTKEIKEEEFKADFVADGKKPAPLFDDTLVDGGNIAIEDDGDGMNMDVSTGRDSETGRISNAPVPDTIYFRDRNMYGPVYKIIEDYDIDPISLIFDKNNAKLLTNF